MSSALLITNLATWAGSEQAAIHLPLTNTAAPIWGKRLFKIILVCLALGPSLLLWRSETYRRKRNREIYRLAHTDALTGLANRRHMYAVGGALLMDSARTEALALIYLDLDGFKDVNDTLGHDIGDELLIEVGRRLRDCSRQKDLLARLGGDEFAILLQSRSLDDLKMIADRMLKRLSQPFYVKGKSITIGASLGIAPAPPVAPGLSFSQLLTQADIAMYQAKRRCQGQGSALLWTSQGRSVGSKRGMQGATVVFGAEMQRAAIARVQLEMDLRQAIPNGELRVCYQPIFSLTKTSSDSQTKTEDTKTKNGRVVSRPSAFEVLVRWQHPQRGLLLPQEFLPEADSIDQIVDIDRWVLAEVCRALGEWQSRLEEGYPLSLHVNLSRRSLAQPDLLAFVSRQLRQHKVQPSRLTLEILEETIIDENPLLEENLHALRALGVHLSLDDFGTGYSSLSYLHRLPIHGIKIDRAFVSNMQTSRENREIIRSIVALAKSLGLETVAEGIESHEQLMQLEQLQCDYGQGILLAGGLTEAEAKVMVTEQRMQRVY